MFVKIFLVLSLLCFVPIDCDVIFNENIPYTETKIYQGIQEFFDREQNKQVCYKIEDYKSFKNPEPLREFLAQYPEIEDQFRKFEELGSTFILITRRSATSKFVNNYVQKNINCWKAYKQALAVLQAGPFRYTITDTIPPTFQYEGYAHVVVLCPPFTYLRGRSETGILCSRFAPDVRPNTQISTLIPEEYETPCRFRNIQADSDAHCDLAYNGGEDSHICKKGYTVPFYREEQECMAPAETCADGYVPCGFVGWDRKMQALPREATICCSKVMQRDYPLTTFATSDEELDEHIDVLRLYQFLLKLDVCRDVVVNNTIPVRCEKRNDLIIVLDGSGSVGINNFNTAKDFVRRLASAFESTPAVPTRTGFIVYSNQATIVVPLRNGLTVGQIYTAITQANYDGGGTATHLAIDSAVQEFGPAEEDVPRKLVVITDGFSNDKVATRESAMLAWQAGIEVFSVGIGNNVDGQELSDIVDGTQGNVYAAVSFDALIHQIRPLSINVCN